MSSNSQVCHEGIQGVYRNSVVRHLRCVLKEAYPEDWRQRLFDSFKQEEIDVVRKNAELRRTTGELGAPLTDDFDLLSVNHFRNLFDKYFDLLFPFPASLKTSAKRVVTRSLDGLRKSRISETLFWAILASMTWTTMMLFASWTLLKEFWGISTRKRLASFAV